MKKIIPFILLTVFGYTQEFKIPDTPKNPIPVYDYIGILTSQQKNYLNNKLVKYSDTTSTQIVIAIVNTVKPHNINLLGAEWAGKWGIGQEGKDNGIFILIAKNDRKITIRTGYGVEGKMTTLITKQITDRYISPYFKKGYYFEGIESGTNAIISVMSGEFKNTPQQKPKWGSFIIIIIFGILIFLFLTNKGGGGDNYGSGGRRGMSGTEALLMGMFLSGGMGRGSSYGGGGSSFGGGGSFGGFGGGGFSGGGASGGW